MCQLVHTMLANSYTAQSIPSTTNVDLLHLMVLNVLECTVHHVCKLQGKTALMAAVFNCDLEIVKLLLAHGADVHAEIGLTEEEVSISFVQTSVSLSVHRRMPGAASLQPVWSTLAQSQYAAMTCDSTGSAISTKVRQACLACYKPSCSPNLSVIVAVVHAARCLLHMLEQAATWHSCFEAASCG